MAKKKASPIMTWIFWSISVLGVFLLVTWEYFVAGFSADSSNITYLIVVFFIYGFFATLRLAYYLQGEAKALEVMEANHRLSDANTSDAAALFDAAMERIRRGERIEVKNLVSAYSIKIKARTDNIAVISGMLITIGLLGTVVGLIITVTGLGDVLKFSGSDYAAMKEGLNQTVAGMGTAFYTTFFGALLGGVVLKVLGSEMKKSATLLVADTLRFSELFLAPQFSQNSSEALVQLEAEVVVLGGRLQQLGASFTSVIDIIDSKQQTLASGLGELVSTVEQANRQAGERVEGLMASVEKITEKVDDRMGTLVTTVDKTVEETNRMADERLGAMVSTIEETNRLSDERLQTITSAVEQNLADTNRRADERIEALVSTSQTIGEETIRTSAERLEVLTNTIDKITEETHRLADERLKALLGSVEKAAEDTQRQASERMVDLVDQVGQSIEVSGKQAEERLGSRASDLARKLTEAAGALAALATPVEPESTEE